MATPAATGRFQFNPVDKTGRFGPPAHKGKLSPAVQGHRRSFMARRRAGDSARAGAPAFRSGPAFPGKHLVRRYLIGLRSPVPRVPVHFVGPIRREPHLLTFCSPTNRRFGAVCYVGIDYLHQESVKLGTTGPVGGVLSGYCCLRGGVEGKDRVPKSRVGIICRTIN